MNVPDFALRQLAERLSFTALAVIRLGVGRGGTFSRFTAVKSNVVTHDAQCLNPMDEVQHE